MSRRCTIPAADVLAKFRDQGLLLLVLPWPQGKTNAVIYTPNRSPLDEALDILVFKNVSGRDQYLKNMGVTLPNSNELVIRNVDTSRVVARSNVIAVVNNLKALGRKYEDVVLAFRGIRPQCDH